MYRSLVLTKDKSSCLGRHVFISLWALLLCSGVGALAQNTGPALNTNAPFSIRAIHLLGLGNAKDNCKGILSIQNNVLRFRQSGKPAAELDIASVRHVFLGEEGMQVGGLPMTIGKTAAPFGGGRVVSLFAHAKFDTLTLEYLDANGGLHGSIFQLKKGQGELVRNELVARGVSSSSSDDQLKNQSTSEVTNEDK
jgi:hypothetical protein